MDVEVDARQIDAEFHGIQYKRLSDVDSTSPSPTLFGPAMMFDPLPISICKDNLPDSRKLLIKLKLVQVRFRSAE
jgi:hypothetical protein